MADHDGHEHDEQSHELKRRSPEETERELRVGGGGGAAPGGAEGGDRSPAADRPGAFPADDDAPLGDTDQHSSSEGLPGQRAG